MSDGVRKPKKALTALFVRTVTEPGKHFDGNGLFLRVNPNGSKAWVQRITIRGKRSELGLGNPGLVLLAEARELARENRKLAQAGGDPMAVKRKARAVPTFEEAVEFYLAGKLAEFRNEKHKAQWRSTLDSYATPFIGALRVDQIGTQDVVRLLQPIWTTKTETASRLRGRVEAVLSWATVAGHRAGDNPARWSGNLAELLPKPTKVAKGGNQPALALADVPRWWLELAKREGIAARALEFLTMTAARSGEVRGMTWGEIEFDGAATSATTATWIVPAERMKMKRPHRVPLTAEVVVLLRRVAGGKPGTAWAKPADDALVFAAPRGGMLSDMTLSAVMRRMQEAEVEAGRQGFLDPQSKRPAVPHGIRSSFRDWAAEQGFDRDMTEMALAHAVGDATERAYRRTDFLERRRELLAAWDRFLRGERLGGTVVSMRAAGDMR
jgi:integrase